MSYVVILAIWRRLLWTVCQKTGIQSDRVLKKGPDLPRRRREVESPYGSYQSAKTTPTFTIAYDQESETGELRFDLADLTVCVAVVHEEPDVTKPLASYDAERECFIIRGSMHSKATAEALKRAVKVAHRVISGELLN